MNDPSQPVLALAFVVTLISAIAAILLRSMGRERQSGPHESAPSEPLEGSEPPVQDTPPALHQDVPPSLHQDVPPSLHQDVPPSLHQDIPPSLHQDVPPSLPVGKVHFWFYRPGDLGGALLLYLLFAALFALSCSVPQPELAEMTADALVVNMIFQLLLAGGVTAAALRLCSLNRWLGWRWKEWPWVFLIGPGAVALMLFIFYGLERSGYVKWMESLGVETIQDTVSLLQQCQDPLVLTLLVITATLIAPVCEEIVFRGYLHPIMKKFGGVWAGAFCSSLLFSIAHGNLAVMLPLFLLGALLVWIYELTGSIWAPISVHFCFNATTVIAQLYGRNMEEPVALLPSLPFWP